MVQAADIKEKVLDGLVEGRKAAVRALRDFRSESGYYQARAGIIGGYVVLVLISLVVIPPASERNPLDAKIKVGQLSFGSREKTFVELTNDSSHAWDPVTVTLTGTVQRNGKAFSGTWVTKERVKRGERRTLFPEQFLDKAGLRAELDIQVQEVTLEVDGVRYTRSMARKGPSP